MCIDTSYFSVFSYGACALASEVIKIDFTIHHSPFTKIDFTIHFLITELSKMSNLNTFGAQLSDFWPFVVKIGK